MKLKEIIKGKIPIHKEFKRKKDSCKCGICGDEGVECWSDVVSDNFNNFEDVLSLDFCKDCLPLFHEDYRKKNFYITEQEAKIIAQKDFYDILHNIKLPCILSFTDSNKKHRLFRSKISTEKENICIVLDDSYLFLDLTTDLELLDMLNEFYKNNKISKEWILNGSYPVNAIKKLDLKQFLEFEEKIKPYRGSAKLDYLLKFCNK